MTARRPVHVLLVDDSALARELVGAVLTRAGMQVTIAPDGEVAIDKIKQKRVDVVVLDLLLPRLDGLGFLRRTRAFRAIPVVVCSNMGEGSEAAKRAVEEGACAVVAKPRMNAGGALERKLSDALVLAVRKAAKRRGDSMLPPAPREVPAPPESSSLVQARGGAPALIAIGASTGGTDALRVVLAEIPSDAPPVMVVQHMTERFIPAFARRLAEFCGTDVREAAHGEPLGPGMVRIAPGRCHARVGRSSRGLHVELVDSAPVSGHRPSADVLFTSVAESVGARARGVLMTGMGVDGADGLLAMRRAGALTLAQDRATSVVFGMPGAAIARGAVDDVLPLQRIASALFGEAHRAKRLAVR